ncbi:MAG: transcriptional regulator MarR family [Ramlibacter sp.]|nr:transcriptional regulator MarR family [Ramlibacter sp.]
MSTTESPAKATRAGASRAWRDVLHDERMTHLIRTALRCTSSALQRRLKQQDVLYGHWTFLRILWQTDGLTQRQLSEQADVTEPSTVTALQAMEKLGYLTRQKMPGNKKQIRVFLTPKGMSLRSLIVPCAEEVNRMVVAGISAEDLAATRRTLLAVIENLSGDSEEAREPAAAQERLEAQELG